MTPFLKGCPGGIASDPFLSTLRGCCKREIIEAALSQPRSRASKSSQIETVLMHVKLSCSVEADER